MGQYNGIVVICSADGIELGTARAALRSWTLGLREDWGGTLRAPAQGFGDWPLRRMGEALSLRLPSGQAGEFIVTNAALAPLGGPLPIAGSGGSVPF